MTPFSLTDQFLNAAVDLQKEQANKLLKSILLFYKNPRHPSLNYEKLGGKAAAMHSIRVDDSFRVILQSMATATIFHFVGKHDDAYRAAERITPVISARINAPRPA